MLLPYFEWIQELPVGVAIRESRWLFPVIEAVLCPVIEAVHLLAFATLGGAVLLVSLRLLGYQVGQQTPSEVAADVRPWFLGSLLTVAGSGTLLFIAEAVKCYNSSAFQIKISALAGVVALTAVSQRRVTSEGTPAAIQRASAVTTLVLWALVAWGGRWIGIS
jgi:hypothetical protein